MPSLDGLTVTASSGGGAAPTFLVGPTVAPASGRGVIVQLGSHTGVNLNSVAQTTIFTTPGSGFFLCVPVFAVLDNFSGTSTTNACSYGASGTPTDWMTSGVIQGGTTKAFMQSPIGISTQSGVYGAGINFVINVTVGGAAITADVTVWGYYHG